MSAGTKRLRTSGAPPERARHGIVLIHGRGGSAADILSLLDHAGLPEVAAVAPEAPGNSWWPTSFLAPSAQMEPHVVAGMAAVEAAFDMLRAAGLPSNRLWVAGFSQGACLALEYMARAAHRPAGAFGFSGGLVGTSDATDAPEAGLYGHRPKHFDYAAGMSSAPVWLSVHANDPHIPLQRLEDSAAAFERLGALVTLKVYPGAGHAVMREDIAALRAVLNG